ncbi:MAG: hypothetical protein QGD96_13625, partial [Anaerolineae bacterium]|nr:hypothetical protein [Anaerolineae bacterium]
MSNMRVKKMKVAFSKSGKIGGLFKTAQIYVTTAIENNAAERQKSRASSNYRQKIRANKLRKLEQKWQAERNKRAYRAAAADPPTGTFGGDRRQAAIQAEMQPKRQSAPAAQAASARTYQTSRARGTAANVAAPPKDPISWWQKAKQFVQEKIVEPVKTFVRNKIVQPAKTAWNTVKKNVLNVWNPAKRFVQEKVYTPYIEPVVTA